MFGQHAKPCGFFCICAGRNVNALPSQENYTAIMFAALNGEAKVVELLLENGADCEVTNVHQFTALGAASLKGHNDVVRILLNAKADATRPDVWQTILSTKNSILRLPMQILHIYFIPLP